MRTLLPLWLFAPVMCACNWSSSTASPLVDAGRSDALVAADAPHVPDATHGPDAMSQPDAPMSTCPAPTGAVIPHGSDITQDESWAGDGSIHHVTVGFTIRPGATLTLEACAVVKVDRDQTLTIAGTAAQPATLVSKGTASQGVIVTASDPSGPWGCFRAYAPQSTLDLSYTTFDKGGSQTNLGATFDLRGTDPAIVTPMLRADHLTVSGSAGIGIAMQSGAAFTADSTAVQVVGSGSATDDAAIEITPLAAGTLPPLTISGNARDQVRIAAPVLAIPSDLRLKNVGAPYYFRSDRVRVTSTTGAPTLTVDPGVELRFDDYLIVGLATAGAAGQPGKLLAVGTATEPIVFTSAKVAPAAGDWPGIYLMNAVGSRLENVRIEYAGGSNGVVSANCRPVGSSDNAALFIGGGGGTYVPLTSDFVGVTVANSASHGIDAMWTAASFGPDLTGAFTFQTLGGCRQTKNGLTTGCGTQSGCLVP